MATEEGQLMTKVMPNKTVGINLQSSLTAESSSFSTIQDFARNCYTETSSNDSSSISGIDVDTIPFTPIQKKCLKEKLTNVTKLNRDIELTGRIKKQSLSDGHLPGILQKGETEDGNDSTDDDSTLLKKQTHNVVLPDHIDFFARSAFPLILNAKGTEPSVGLTELSSTTCSSLNLTTNSVKSKTEVFHKKQNLKLSVPLTSAKCLPNSNISLFHSKDDKKINLSMPSSVYGTQLSNIECVLTGLNLDQKKMNDDQISELEPHIEQQIVHLAGGSVNLISGIQDDAQSRDSTCRGEEEKCNEKSIKPLEGNGDVISKVTDDNYFSSQKQILDTLQENHKNSIISYPSVLNTTAVHDNLKLYNVQKATKTQSLEQHISKLIAQNAAIVDTLNPIRPRHYVRHLSFSEPINEREHRKSSITSKLRRFSEDLSSTVNNNPYLVNKSKLQIALMGQSDSGFIVNCKNLDTVPEHKDISAAYPYNLNGMCYTISESEKTQFSPPVSSKSIVPEERDFLKPVTSKTHYNLASNDKLIQLDDKFSGEFTGKLDKQHRKSESSIIKDLLLKPKHTRVSHSTISSAENKLTSQSNVESLGKQKVNEINSSMHICKFCNISFLSKDNLEAHQLHYCKLRSQSGTASKPNMPSGFLLKEQPLLEKLNDSSLALSYETSSVSDDRLSTAGIVGIRNFDNDAEAWIPPLKQRKLSEPILSKSHIENDVRRRRITEFLRNDKDAHSIPSASGGWNSQMCGGKVQIFDEIGNKHATLKSGIRNQTSLFTLLGIESHHSHAFSESGSWTIESGKMKKSNKMSSLPTVVVTISKPELNSGGTVMQVHSSMAASGSSLCVQASSQAPLMATGSSEMAKWKSFQPDISFGTKLDLSPISKNVNESERLANLTEQSPAHCDTPKSLVIESPGTSPLSEMTECGSPSSTHSSTVSFGKQEKSAVRKIGRSENRDFEFSSPLGKSLCVMSVGTTMENTTRKNSSDSNTIPLFCIPDGPSAVFNCISVFSDSSTMPSTVCSVTISLSNDKVQTSSPCKTNTEPPSDNAKNKCPNPSRPTFLPLKKGITLVGSTLISPETPRPKKSSIQLYLGGHAYTSLGLKCSTRSTFCCIYRPQPMYVPQDTDPKLSMYSNWQVVPSKEELLGMTPSQLLGLYNSRQKKESCKATLAIAKMGNTLVCTHSSYWTFRMQDATKEDPPKHSKTSEKALNQDITIEDKSHLESITTPVEISYVLPIENCSFISKDQAKMDENSTHSLKENSHSEDTAEESCTSHSNAHSPDDTMLSNPPKRARQSEGSCCTTDEGTYVRGRGWGKYICEECGIRCKKPSVLKKHIRTHTNLRPYKCYHCAFAFKTKGNLTKHMKSKAHFKKCIELGVVPVPTTVDDSQIDEEALDKQEKLDKDICPSLNSQEFQDGEEIDDDADESERSENEEDDECNSDTLNLGERIREIKILKEKEQVVNANEKEFAAARDMTEKEGEAAQSLLHLSTCNVSQSSHKKSSAKLLSSALLSIEHSEDSQSSSVLGSEITVIQNSSIITDFEDSLSSPLTSKGMATSPIISSNPHRGSAKITSGASFAITDSAHSPGQIFSENRSLERKSGSFENISPLPFRVTSPNSDYRERPQTMWTTTSPQSWHGHSSLSLFPNSHIKYQSKGIIWDGQLLDTNVPKPVQFVVDTDQPMDLRVSKTKERISEETSRLALYEDWRISQNVVTDHIVRTENPKTNPSVQSDEELQCCKPDAPQNTQEQKTSCLTTDNLSPKPTEENSIRPTENIIVTKCQDSKSYAKPIGCHENSIPAYNVGRSEPPFETGVGTQIVQYELPAKSVDDCVDSESQSACPISPISPPIVEDTINHLPVLFHENTAVSSHSISKSDNGMPQRQRECLEKNRALRNSYVSEGKCTCAICNKTFTKPSQLRLHVNIHYFERPFRCDDCAISFRTNGHLEKHKRSASHYNKLHTNTSFGTPCADNPRPFKCSDCNIAFRMHGHLAKHLRSKMHIMKLECLGKLPFGMYAEMERTGVNFNDIDTTDCDNSLESLQEIAQHLYTTPNAQQSMDLTTQSVQTTKPKPHFLNSSYSSATSLQIINTGSSCYNNSPIGEIQQMNPTLSLSPLNNCSNDRARKLSQEKGLAAVNDRAGVECRTVQKEYIAEFSHLDASAQSPLHSRTCPCDSCISSKITSFSNLGDSCTSRPVKKEQWKLKDRLIAEFQEESTHMENPR